MKCPRVKTGVAQIRGLIVEQFQQNDVVSLPIKEKSRLWKIL